MDYIEIWGNDMSKIFLSSNMQTGITILQNQFIDEYMPTANGSFVKVYIYLLRCISNHMSDISISFLAEKLDETEKDIERALKYWEKEQLIKIERDQKRTITSILFCELSGDQSSKDLTAATNLDLNEQDNTIANEVTNLKQNSFHKPNYSEAQIAQLTDIDEVKFMMNTLEQYLERLLKPTDVQLVLFLYESVGFSAELILYLYEYCVSKNKKSASYIETVALSWAEEGIDTVEKAEAATTSYNNNYNAVIKAFGLNRAPGTIEKKFMHRWFHTFKFEINIIEDACNRTILSTGKPDFKYADKILENWYKKGVTQKSDIDKLDEEHAKLSAMVNNNKQTNTTKPVSNNKFNAFPQRNYTKEEYLSMEQRLLNRQ